MPTPASKRSSPGVLRVKGLVGPVASALLGPFERFRGPVSTRLRPILVCGSPHSGTTVVARFIGQHPEIYTVPYESNIFRTVRPKWSIDRAFRDWSAEARERGRSRICEKTPAHVFHIDRMFRSFPMARVAVVERDGRDVVASLAARWRGDVERAANEWVAAVEATRRWRTDDRVLVVRYEEFVTDTAAVVARLAEHAGEAYTDKMLAPDESWQWTPEALPTDRPESEAGDHHQPYRAWQVNQPLFDGRGKWRDALNDDQLEVCRRIAGPLLDELGYAASGSW